MAIQHPALPWEITDGIIDHLHSDLRALGICSTVCSEWLIRSRHHIFSTVQLWPWRVQRFFDLAKSPSCTFTQHIHRIELDDLRTGEKTQDARPTLQGKVLFNEAMAQSHIRCFSQVESMQVKNVDWTALSPMQQEKLRERLAKFSRLNRLEFQGVIFHDLREVIRIVTCLPSLRELSAHISFLKYLEHTMASARTLRLPSYLQTIELGTDEGIPVVLSCLAGKQILALKLENIKCSHLQYVSTALKRFETLQHVSLGFAEETLQTIGADDFVDAINLSHLSRLRTLHMDGLRIQGGEAILVPILQRIESSLSI